MTSEDQIMSDEKNFQLFIAEQMKEKQETLKLTEESLQLIEELERQERVKRKMERKIKDLQGKHQDAMNEVFELQTNLHDWQDLKIGLEELMLKLQEASTLTIQLGSQLDEKQKLESTIEESKWKLLGANNPKYIDEINEQLQIKIDEVHSLEELNQVLLLKERGSNDDLLKARNALIQGFTDIMNGKASIGIKRMGEIDIKPFQKTLKQRGHDEPDTEAIELCSYWQEKVRDPNWHPFMVVSTDNGDFEETINEDDVLLSMLMNEWGAEIYEAVITAMKEVNEYNSSGRYMVSEIWNFKENRKATTEEAIVHLLNQVKTLKRKRCKHHSI